MYHLIMSEYVLSAVALVQLVTGLLVHICGPLDKTA